MWAIDDLIKCEMRRLISSSSLELCGIAIISAVLFRLCDIGTESNSIVFA